MKSLSLGECQKMCGFWKVGYKRIIDQIDEDRTICTNKITTFNFHACHKYMLERKIYSGLYVCLYSVV